MKVPGPGAGGPSSRKATNADKSPHEGTVALPFQASVSGNANLTPSDDPCFLRNDETGAGTATMLGAFQWRDVESVGFCAIPGGVSVVASCVMTAANGDELAGEMTTTGTFATRAGTESTSAMSRHGIAALAPPNGDV